MSLNPNLEEMSIRLTECHNGHPSIIHTSEECPLCTALDQISKLEKEIIALNSLFPKLELKNAQSPNI